MSARVPEVILKLDKAFEELRVRIDALASDYEDLVAVARKLVDGIVEKENRHGVDETIVDPAALEMLREELP